MTKAPYSSFAPNFLVLPIEPINPVATDTGKKCGFTWEGNHKQYGAGQTATVDAPDQEIVYFKLSRLIAEVMEFLANSKTAYLLHDRLEWLHVESP